ncbi:uncharacterized protein PHACADRAFT_150667 [Phanerochaete carnosa HHB-10118-sp]|uniref:ABM domain-containing protein n=1 Tax=Phanerochaete carnosa (strain HHB-10118-sp) TaxID=650164 RepID=K5VKG6_PHACS|nr:uncharacterized protein PHACADRAFT_150667 [Phanerochaete carnosa HHB-10118-sp]EKM51873.1 hypothetical protein PHACADRAFT_150667 [Phanerochaete carnosa HHB-10118-sp]
MPLPVAEIAKLVASDAYRADPTVVNEALEILAKTPGFIAAWHGLEIQDPQYLYAVILWESVEHHRALIADQVAYPAIGEKMRKVSNGRVWLYHVHFNAEVDKALNAPTTELALMTVKDSVETSQYLETAKTIVPQIYSTLPNEVFEGGWGPTVENDRKFMICLGWHSVERFFAAFKGAPELFARITALKELSEVDLRHAKLTKY